MLKNSRRACKRPLFTSISQGLKARQMIAQGKRDEIRAALGKRSNNSPKPRKGGSVSERSNGFPFLDLLRQFRVVLATVNEPHGSLCDHPVE